MPSKTTTLTGIQVDGGTAGQAFGGGIYNMSATFGGSTDTTKVTLNIISEDGSYQIDDTSLNVSSTGGHNIKVGAVIFYNMYLYKYGFSQTGGQRTLNVEFVDASICLDKVYVGLNVRHAPAAAGGSDTFSFDINCVECNNLEPTMQQTTASATRRTSTSAAGTLLGHPMNGGYILVGREAWSDAQCSIPNVDYSFSELITEIGKFNPAIGTNLASFNRNSAYRQSYVGTLREVLNNWASDFGFEFYFDPFSSSPNIVGVDLTSASTTLDSLKAAINIGFDETSGALLRSVEETRSLEGTYRREPIVKSLKPGKSFSRNQVAFEERTIKPLTVTDIIGYNGHLGRTDDELYTSIALAKYQTEARNIWLSGTIAAKGKTGAGWASLGFIPDPVYGEITNNEHKEQIAISLGQLGLGNNASWSHPIWNNPDNYYMYVGVYNETYQAHVESFDNELGDFIGKYGYFSVGGEVSNPPKSFRKCPDTQAAGIADASKFYDLSSKVSSLPPGKLHEERAYPFSNLLRANNGSLFLAQNNEPIYVVPLDDNAWGTHNSHVDDLFQNEWIESDVAPQVNYSNPDGSNPIPQTDLHHYIPVFARLTANMLINEGLSIFKTILPDFEQNYLAQDKRIKGYFPGIAVIPKLSALTLTDPETGQSKEVLSVSTGGQIPNTKVFDNQKRKILEMTGESKKTCTLYCDEDVISQVCECPEIQDPIHHFESFDARSIVVGSHKGSTHIIFPIEGDYIGYVKAEMTYRGTYPRQVDILGTPPAPTQNLWDSNYMQADIMDVDATSELDPHLGTNGMVQKFLIFGQSNSLDINGLYTLLKSGLSSSVTMRTTGGSAPNQRMNLTIDGTDYDTVSGFINPQYGLVGFSLSLDGEGMTSNLEFANRHPKPPKRETIMQKIGPRATQGKFNPQPTNINHHSGLNTQFIPWA